MNSYVTPLTKRYQVLFAVVCLGLIAMVDLQAFCAPTNHAGVSIARADFLSEIGGPTGSVVRLRSAVSPVAIVPPAGHSGIAGTPLFRIGAVPALPLPSLRHARQRAVWAFDSAYEEHATFSAVFFNRAVGSGLELWILGSSNVIARWKAEKFAFAPLSITDTRAKIVSESRGRNFANVRAACVTLDDSHSIPSESFRSGLRGAPNAVAARSYFTANRGEFA
jgi:hypothetical protein